LPANNAIACKVVGETWIRYFNEDGNRRNRGGVSCWLTKVGKRMNTPHRTALGFVLLISSILFATYVSAQSPPTATEAFNLRIQCKKFSDEKARELLETNTTLLKWELVTAWNTAKYDPMSNRCYGRIYEHIVKRSNRLDHESDQVFDLQTDDLLAAAMIEEGKKHGNIFDPDYKKPWLPLCSAKGCAPDFGDKTWQATEDYMNEFMADPRR
jgi:hypothetical protein